VFAKSLAALAVLLPCAGAYAGRTEHILYAFAGNDGALPYAGLVADKAGNLYGATLGGGANGGGTVFKLTPAGQQIVLHSFTGGADGYQPYGTLIIDRRGNLYGTTYGGGDRSSGVVFKLRPDGREIVLHSFVPIADGAGPYAGLVADKSGNLYGTTSGGGDGNSGTVYKITRPRNKTTLYSFTGGDDGNIPEGGLVIDAAGTLYGTTRFGGANNLGVVFAIAPDGQETVVHTFAGGSDGLQPRGDLTLGPDGSLYGTTWLGGVNDDGVVFKITTSGEETVLHTFDDGAGGSEPYGRLFVTKKGTLFGTTSNGGVNGWGTAFKLNSRGKFSVLYSFAGGTDSALPYAGLLLGPSGALYGTAYQGGGSDCDSGVGCGTVFVLSR
jgi:uncharacterized repeat protein (TIGR03803 family)